MLRTLPGGVSPQTALARARKSGVAAGWAGTTLATTWSCCVTGTSSPAATQRKISGHCCGTCCTLAVFMAAEYATAPRATSLRIPAVEMGATAKDLSLCVHPHPTLSETLMESAEVFYGHATHVFARKK